MPLLLPFGESRGSLCQPDLSAEMTSTEPDEVTPAPCPRCQAPMEPKTVRTAIWQDDRVAIVEEIPAFVCSECMEQFYDEDVSDALRQLTEDGLPASAADREIAVPVFSLKGRIRKRRQMPEDTYVD